MKKYRIVSMRIKITTLCENTAGKMGLLGEWGFSALVEKDGEKILLDTGSSTTVAHNASQLGIDLSGVDTIVLSHGHLDHTGGLASVLGITGSARIFAHPDALEPKEFVSKKGEKHDVGIPYRRGFIEGLEKAGEPVPEEVAPVEMETVTV